MTALIKFEDLDIAALTVIAAEQYEECLWAIEKALDKQLAFGRLLRIVKEKLPHGEWGTWVRETFTDHKSLRTIQRYMRGADSIATDPSLLECADSLDGILKIVEERKPSVIKDVNSVLELSSQSRHFDERMLDDTTMVTGIASNLSVLVQPHTSPGYAHVSILIGEACTWTKRGILRDAVPAMLEMELPEDARIEWEFFESANRVSEAMFKSEESLTSVSLQMTDECMGVR